MIVFLSFLRHILPAGGMIKKLDRFVKRSMENTEYSRPCRKNRIPLIALHKNSVTVRQIFSADPATKAQADFRPSAVAPFPSDSCLALSNGTDGYRASIQAIQFFRMVTPVNTFVNSKN